MGCPEAARYIGVGITKFNEMVPEGRIPKPNRIESIVVWDCFPLDAAFTNLPNRPENIIDELLQLGS
jgi:hypothetical protein